MPMPMQHTAIAYRITGAFAPALRGSDSLRTILSSGCRLRIPADALDQTRMRLVGRVEDSIARIARIFPCLLRKWRKLAATPMLRCLRLRGADLRKLFAVLATVLSSAVLGGLASASAADVAVKAPVKAPPPPMWWVSGGGLVWAVKGAPLPPTLTT